MCDYCRLGTVDYLYPALPPLLAPSLLCCCLARLLLFLNSLSHGPNLLFSISNLCAQAKAAVLQFQLTESRGSSLCTAVCVVPDGNLPAKKTGSGPSCRALAEPRILRLLSDCKSQTQTAFFRGHALFTRTLHRDFLDATPGTRYL